MNQDLAFGRQLRLLRKTRDLTQETLAQQAFCAVDTVKKIERGVRRPSRQLAEQLADCLVLAGEERAAFLAAARTPAPYQPTAAHRATPHYAKFPRPPALLVGRTVELAALGALFADPTTQLVTLVGPGGSGKTRLALAAGEQLLSAPRFSDGVCFIGLAALDTAEQIVPALAEALDITLDMAKTPIRTLRQQVFDYLQAKRLLLILDNVEHLLAAPNANGGDDAASLVAALLDHAPGVAILTTTRTRLQLRQEHLYPLGGLDIGDEPERSSAVALFVQAARRLQPEFSLTPGRVEEVARICRMVDGMPLAIELAAGWIDTLSLSTITAEIARSLDLLATDLRDMPPRHRSMRAVFDSSYQRLDVNAQRIFARLAILRGGGTLQAVQAVTLATIAQIQGMIAASLLSYDAAHGRYSIHELLRQYAAEKLAAQPDDEEEARRQHAVYFCGFAQQQRDKLAGAGQQAALAALDSDRGNLRVAFIWAAQHARLDLLAGAAESLGYYFEWRAVLEIGEDTFGRLAALLDAQPNSDAARRLRALARAWQGNFRRLQGDIVGAEHVLQQSLALLEGMLGEDTRVERAFVLLQLGLSASEGALDAARGYLDQSLALYQALDRRWEASHVLLWLGDVARYRGDFAEARRHFRASLAIRSACGDRRGAAEVMVWDSHAAADSGQTEEAEALARRSYALFAELGGPANQAFGLSELAVILMYAGKYDESYGALQQSLELYQEMGNPAMCAYVRGWLAMTYLAAGEYTTARRLSRQATAQARALRGAESGLAFLLHYSGWIALTLGAFREAESLLQESIACHRQVGSTSMVNWPQAQLGYVLWRLGKQAQAQAVLHEVIRASSGQHAFVPLVLALPTVALMLAEQGQSLRAVELYALVWRYPLLANAQSSIDSFGKALDAVVAALPPELAAAAQARGQDMNLWDAAAALDAELTLLGWGAATSSAMLTDPKTNHPTIHRAGR